MSENICLSGELVDIVDPHSAEPTGEQLDKAIAHHLSLWHRDVHVWVSNGTHLLQQQRQWNKKIMPGKWDISTGEHVHAGESFLKAACRGAHEELGMEVSPEHLIRIGLFPVEMPIEGGKWVHRVVSDNFVLIEPDLQPENLENRLILQPSEVIAARLYSIDQLEADIADPATANQHGEHPRELWQFGIDAIRRAIE